MNSSYSVVPSVVVPVEGRHRAVRPNRTPHLKKWARKLNPLRLLYRCLTERNRLLVEHLPQVQFIARGIHRRLPQHISLEDLVSAGTLGLIEAVDRFDPSKKIKLASYSKARVRGAILDSLRELDWCPRTLRRKGREIDQANQRLGNRLGRMPSEAELAAELGIALGRLQRLRRDLHGAESVNLRLLNPQDRSDGDGDSNLPAEAGWGVSTEREDPFSLCLRSEMARLLTNAMQELSARRRQVLTLYYLEEMTMKEVGARLRVGESRVSQLHSIALSELRGRVVQLLASYRCGTGLAGQRRSFPTVAA